MAGCGCVLVSLRGDMGCGYVGLLGGEVGVCAEATPASASPMTSRGAPPSFSFDWSFDYYPLGYHRPGPLMQVYRLGGPRCAARPAGEPQS